MKTPESQADLELLIKDAVEESLTLDYKAADSLANTDGKKKDITKDVSAMANSDGGLIIYGIREHADPALKHKPEALDPVDRTAVTKEWLEHVINNIRPRLAPRIVPIPLDTGPNHGAYVVEVPQSDTAHQAVDFRYYRRFNFESVPMHDYEVRDVMGRAKAAKFEVHTNIVKRAQLPHMEYRLAATTRTTARSSTVWCSRRSTSSPSTSRTARRAPRTTSSGTTSA
jgi:predicted HTH transcriptional regulator